MSDIKYISSSKFYISSFKENKRQYAWFHNLFEEYKKLSACQYVYLKMTTNVILKMTCQA